MLDMHGNTLDLAGTSTTFLFTHAHEEGGSAATTKERQDRFGLPFTVCLSSNKDIVLQCVS